MSHSYTSHLSHQPSFLSLFILFFLSLYFLTPFVFCQYKDPTGSSSDVGNVCLNHYHSVGPFHVTPNITDGTDLTDPNDIGAAQSVWQKGDIAYLATVNGGVWKTTAFHSKEAFGGPHWIPTSDYLPCLSMSSVYASSTDSNFVLAGCGYPSNGGAVGSEPLGAMISTNGAQSWSMTNFPQGYAISSVLLSGSSSGAHVLLVSASSAVKATSSTGQTTDPYGVGSSTGGIWTSGDLGVTWTKVYDAAVHQLMFHATDSSVIYASRAGGDSMENIVLISTNSGSSFAATGSSPPVTTCTNAGANSVTNHVISNMVSGGATYLYSASYLEEYDTSGNYVSYCYAFSWSSNEGATWTAISNVPTASSSVTIGEQGSVNLAIKADPSDSSVLYVGGTAVFTARVNRLTNTWTPLADGMESTYQARTKSNTASHADARNFWWDTSSDELLLTNDGGLYKRTGLKSGNVANGDWISLAGDLATTEIYSAEYDYKTGCIVFGAQDNSVFISQFDGSESTSGVWAFQIPGDGTMTSMDDSTTPTTFYASAQQLGNWASLTPSGGVAGKVAFAWPGTEPSFQFITPQAFNKGKKEILVCSDDSNDVACYSTKFPNTATALEFNYQNKGPMTVYAYGGTKDNQYNQEVIFALSLDYIWARDSVPSAPTQTTNIIQTTPFYTSPISLAQHPADYFINCVVTADGHIWLTIDFGVNFINLNDPVSSNLLSVTGHTSADTFRTSAAYFMPRTFGTITNVYPLLIATPNGIFVSFTPLSTPLVFIRVGAALPRVLVSTLFYSAPNDILMVASFGRGVFQLVNASSTFVAASQGVDTTVINSNCRLALYPNVTNAYQGAVPSQSVPSSTGGGGTNTQSSTGSTGPTVNDQTVTVTLTLNLLSSLIAQPTFLPGFIRDIAQGLGISESRIVIVFVRAGSIVTQFSIQPATGAAAGEMTAAAALASLQSQVSSGSGALYSGVYTSAIVQGSLVINSNSNGSSSSDNTALGVGLGVGLGCGILVLILLVYACTRTPQAPPPKTTTAFGSPARSSSDPARAYAPAAQTRAPVPAPRVSGTVAPSGSPSSQPTPAPKSRAKAAPEQVSVNIDHEFDPGHLINPIMDSNKNPHAPYEQQATEMMPLTPPSNQVGVQQAFHGLYTAISPILSIPSNNVSWNMQVLIERCQVMKQILRDVETKWVELQARGYVTSASQIYADVFNACQEFNIIEQLIQTVLSKVHLPELEPANIQETIQYQDGRVLSCVSSLFEGISGDLIRANLLKMDVLYNSKMFVHGSVELLFEMMKSTDVSRYTDVSAQALAMRITPAQIQAAASSLNSYDVSMQRLNMVVNQALLAHLRRHLQFLNTEIMTSPSWASYRQPTSPYARIYQ